MKKQMLLEGMQIQQRLRNQKIQRQNQTKNSNESASTPKEDFKSLYLRSVADLENFRKRVAKDKQEIIKMANGSLIESLLPVIDTMKLGLQAADNHPEAADIKKGFEMVLEQLNRALQDNGLVELSPEGSF